MFRTKKPTEEKTDDTTSFGQSVAETYAPQPSAPPPAYNPTPAATPPPAQQSNSSSVADALANKIKSGSLGFVGDVLKVTGEIHFKSMLRIDGKFSGQINSVDGTLMISSSGEVSDATIDVGVAMVHGTVNGDITAREQVVLGRTANVTGDVATSALIVEEGAMFNGSCRKI